MNVYEVLADMDRTEGRGVNMQRQHVFLSQDDAIDWCEDQPDPFGRTDREWKDRGDGSMSFGHMRLIPLDVLESLDDLPEARKRREQKSLAASAWAKLTPEEREAFLAEHGH